MSQFGDISIPVPMLFGGVSSQPDQVRFPNQVTEGKNVTFSVQRGAVMRSGSWLVTHVCSGLDEDGQYRMHVIERDSTERYLIIYGRAGGATILRGFDVVNEQWVQIDITTAAQTYLDFSSPSSENLQLLTIVDYTLITNGLKQLDGTDGPLVGDGTIDNTTTPVQMVRMNTNQSGSITSNTVANPTVVTSTAHGLVNDQKIIISGSNSTPSIDGEQVVTVIDANSFSVPVNVTVGGTAGTWVAAAYFKVDLTTWPDRESGDEVSNPLPRPFAEGRVCRTLAYWRGRLALGCGELLLLSEADNLFNVWKADATNIVDSDPIDSQVTSNQVTIIDYLVPADENLHIFTKAGRQFMAEAEGALTYETLKIKPTTNAQTFRTFPASTAKTTWFPIELASYTHLLEYTIDDIDMPTEALDVSLHADRYIFMYENPSTYIRSKIRTVCDSAQNDCVLMLREDRLIGGDVRSNRIYIYQYHDRGGQRVQSAWSHSRFEGVDMGIHDIAVIGDWCYNLECHDGTWFITRCSIPPESDGARVFDPQECT
jgi:hypothetical protein